MCIYFATTKEKGREGYNKMHSTKPLTMEICPEECRDLQKSIDKVPLSVSSFHGDHITPEFYYNKRTRTRTSMVKLVK